MPQTNASFHPLSVSQLCRICNPRRFKFASTEKIPALKGIIGQERALHALMFGLEIKDHGYHIYALGPVGTGKATIIRKYLEKNAKNKPIPSDWLYVNNFENIYKPKKLELPHGKGCELRDDMDKLVLELTTQVPKAFESDAYEEERNAIEKEFHGHSEELFQKLAKKAEERNFRLVQTPHGFAVLPIVDKKVLSPEEYAALEEKKRKEIDTNQEKIVSEVQDAMHSFEQLQKEGQKRMLELDQRVVWFAINHLISALKDKYKKYKEVFDFLVAVNENLLKNVQTFKQIKQTDTLGMPAQERLFMLGRNEPLFEEYKVNLLVDNAKTKGAPIVLEKNPTGPNLIGRIDQQGWFGTLVTNFRMIKSGALHNANGGYLVLDIFDILKKPFAWEVLKRSLKNREVVVESMLESLGAFATLTLEPEPIPLDIKVILVGNPLLYYLIYEFDPEFRELFKVKADFAQHIKWDDTTAYQYAELIGMICREDKLRHFTSGAVAKIVEHGARLVNHQQKLSIRFGDIIDIVKQAGYWADKNSHNLVTAADVEQALEEIMYRSNYLEELLNEMIAEKTIKISVDGAAVGQINGLSVLSVGDYTFAKPSRITARTYVGNAGLVSIEREIELGGPIHNKGSLIITGYLGGKYAQKVPLTLSASIAFEQVYSEIEGDSASAAEIFALLSSLSGLPIRQDLAITGSVNQHGEIQPIGGVNEKIEGFYRTCKILGLTGKQGVIVPESNVQHLMLHPEVVKAAKDGKFHIYSIATVDEGMAILTGKSAGKTNSAGSYPKNTVNFAVQKRVTELAEKAEAFSTSGKKKKANKNAR